MTRPDRPTCDKRNCRYCSCLIDSSKIRSHTTNKTHNTKRNVSCYSNNLVYCISCKKCGKQYVGQTKNSVRQRFVSHFYLIGHKKTEHEVPRHFNSRDHQGIHDVEIHVLESRNLKLGVTDYEASTPGFNASVPKYHWV